MLRLMSVHTTIFDIKIGGRHKNYVVVDGHLTATPVKSVYSGVVSLRGLCTCAFIGELNDMTPWTINVGNAYLEAQTTEKVFVRAGLEIGDLEGYLIVIYKAL